jgi:GAF domain-containing protein
MPAGYQGSERTVDIGRRISEVLRIDTTTPEALTASPPTDPAIRAWAAWILGSLLADEPFSYCEVLVHDPAVDALRVIAERWRGEGATEDSQIGAIVPLEGTVCGTVYRTGAPVLVADVRQHPGYRPIPGAAMRSELAVPLLRDGQPIAVINIESTRVGGLDIADLHRLTALATEAAARATLDQRRALPNT